MANRYISQAGAGLADGTSFANRAPETSFSTIESAVLTGEYLYVSGETITLSAVWVMTGSGKRIVGVNPTTGVVDGSIATLDAGNVRLNCLTGGTDKYIEHLEFIRATGDGVVLGARDLIRNCEARNNGLDGIQGNTGAGSTIDNCEASGNTAIGIDNHYGCASRSKSYSNSMGFYSEFGSFVRCIAYNNTRGFASGLGIHGCVTHNNTFGIDNAVRTRLCYVTQTSITNNTTGINAGSATADKVSESNNYYYGNTIKFGGTPSNIWSLGGSIDGIVDPYMNSAGFDFKPSLTAPTLDTVIPIGLLTETTNVTYENFGLNQSPATTTAPTFLGITKFEILSNNKYRVEWNAGTGSITSYNIYLWTSSGVFVQKPIKIDSTLTSAIVHCTGEMNSLFSGGVVYYCGVRAENNGTEDANTAVLSNICSGAEYIQRMNITNPILSL